jgi:hypothetical protein
MNVVAAIRKYIEKISEESGTGMKILLLDQDTVNIIALSNSQENAVSKYLSHYG